MYQQLQYTGPVYRPPTEAQTLLLQTTVGCAHNSCVFCTMYDNTSFSVDSLEQVENNLKIAKSHKISYERIFLVNGDAFVLSANKLRQISDLIRKHLPSVKTITMYASIRNIQGKTDEELKDLVDNYMINDLYVGLETGNNEALQILNKGYSREEAIHQLSRLKAVGINYIALIMLGALGKGRGLENAKDTADILNKTKPSLLWLLTMRSFTGSKLETMVKEGEFQLADELEILQEKKELIRLLEINNLPFLANHIVNLLPMSGILPRDKEYLMSAIDQVIAKEGEDNLKFILQRNSL